MCFDFCLYRTRYFHFNDDDGPCDISTWFKKWEDTDLIAWVDNNNDGAIQYRAVADSSRAPDFKINGDEFVRGANKERILNNKQTNNENELYIERDITVLANPEIAKLPNWVIALVAAGGLAAALPTASSLLIVISSSVSHDLLKNPLMPQITEKQELLYARLSAAASFFPAIIRRIFSKKVNKEGAVTGMLSATMFTFAYIVYFKFVSPETNNSEFKIWWKGFEFPKGPEKLLFINFGQIIFKSIPPGVLFLVFIQICFLYYEDNFSQFVTIFVIVLSVSLSCQKGV